MVCCKSLRVFACVASIVIGAVGMVSPSSAQRPSGDVVFIPGKTVGLVPPPDFRLSKKFAGFEHNVAGRAAFLLVELGPPSEFPKLRDGLTKESLAPKGITVTSKDALTVDGTSAVIIKGTHAYAGQDLLKWILLMKGKASTIMLTVQAQPGQSITDALVMAALKTIRFRDPPSLEAQIEQLPFAIGTLGGFRVIRTVAGHGVIMTIGNKDIVKDGSQPVMIIIRPTTPINPASAKPEKISEHIMRMSKHVDLTAVGETTEMSVAGGKGYELVGKGTDKSSGRAMTISQWLRLPPGPEIMISAFVDAKQHEALLPKMRAIAAGLKMK